MEIARTSGGNGTILLLGGVLLATVLLLLFVPMVDCPALLCAMSRATPALDPNPRRYEPGYPGCGLCGGRRKVTVVMAWRFRGIPVVGVR